MEMITLLRSESWFDQQHQHMWEGMHASNGHGASTECPRLYESAPSVVRDVGGATYSSVFPILKSLSR